MKTDYTEHINVILETLPESPGCYQYLNSEGVIIYIGKAKNLRKRVNSYFTKEHLDAKTRLLCSHICDIKYMVVSTETDALLLENNLIKQYRPRYNVMLKDDKTYPYIVIRNENFPRVLITRNVIRDGSQYFGPYATAYTAKTMLQMIQSIYKLRTCKLPLVPAYIAKKRYNVCLEYHIKHCVAPCKGLTTLEDYGLRIAEITEILNGNSSHITDMLMKQMQKLADELRFEEAQELKYKYDIIENYRSSSTIIMPTQHNIDVFSFDEDEKSAYINYLHIGNGAIIHVYTFEYKKKLDESKEELLGYGIVEMRKRFESNARLIIVPFLPNIDMAGFASFNVMPTQGDNKKLLDLSIQNVKQYKVDALKRADKFNPEQRTTRLLKTIQNDLHLPVLPMHIECFDNSNIQGTSPVAACVVFKKGKPSKSDYRRFHIKTVVGANDFASMEEVVSRRYSRLIEENKPLPQLIIVDGGKGQLNIATEVLRRLNLLDKITIIGLAKRFEEIYYPGDPVPLTLDKSSETLKVIQHLRDEAHRFGITFHRDVRSKAQIASALDSIYGIGDKTKALLLQKYKSIQNIVNVPEEELAELIGKSKASNLLNALKKQ